MTAREVAAFFPGGKWRGETYETHCSAHSDRHPSLGISPAKNGGVVIHCQAGCDPADVLAAVGLSLKDLAPPPVNGSRPLEPEAIYRYDDERGEPLYEKVRMPGKQFFLRLPGGKGGGIGDVRRVLFGLPELLATKPGETVAIVEGEKDALNVRKRGVAATTNPEGAAKAGQRPKWRPEYTEWLKAKLPDRRFAVFGDQDEAGLAHAEAVVASLKAAGLAVVAVNLGGLAEKEDVSDWLGRHSDAEFLALLRSVPVREESGWDDPLPLGEFEPPAFPVDVLPGWVRDMAEGVAACLAVPVDASAMFILSCLAAACQKRIEVFIRPGWIEPLTLWILIVMPPANRKSPLFRQLLAPVVAYQQQLREDMRAEIAAAAAVRRITEGRLKHAEQTAIKGKTEFQRGEAEREARRLAGELEALVVDAEPRLLVNDATPERLGMLLHENAGRMGVMSPEGDVFEMMAGRYSSGQASLGLYLAGHTGDDWTVDRVGRPSVGIERTAITFGLTVQNDVIAGFADKPQFRGRGLLGRFLYCVPTTLLGSRPAITPAVLEGIEHRYHERLTALLRMPAHAGPDGRPRAHVLEFDSDADAAMAGLQNWIEPQLGPWGELRSMADWAGKLAGNCARIAGLLHVARLAETPEPWGIPLAGESVNSLPDLARYLVTHARIAFQSMGADPTSEGAMHILAWLRDHPVGRFSRRNLHRRLIRTFPSVDEIDKSLAVLMERGYIRQVMPESGTRPGPKPVVFDVHPRYAGPGGELEGG